MKVLRSRKGFTLIELIIVIIIIGILAAVAVPKYAELREQARDATAKGVLGGLRGANSVFFAQAQFNYPTTTTYNMASIVANANISGIDHTWGTNAFTATINATTYVFGMTLPTLPSTPAAIYCSVAPTGNCSADKTW